MTPRVVAAIVRKDLRAFGRDRFFLFMTILGLVVYAVVFHLLPSSVDETVALGVAGDDAAALFADAAGLPGLEIVEYGSRDALADAVASGGGPVAGLALPPGFAADLTAGRPTEVEILVPAGAPAEFEHLAQGIADGLAAGVSGDTAATTRTVVLGADRVGDQVSLQEQMRPLMVFFVLLIETLALATLLATEIHGRTVLAILVTPATTADFLAAKSLLGTMLAFAEAGVLMALIGGLAADPALVLVVLLLGAILVTGLGMIAGSFGKDFLNVLFISILIMIPLMIPAFGVLFPGTAAGWVQALPSFGLVDAIVGVTTGGEGWAEVAPNLALLAGWCAVLFGAGVWILRRKVASL
ncbi:MAG: ABC transporter permease [Actinobacteria bacterium]|nr:ABC transporter permease [Actinomycetota bacterium]